GRRTPHAGQGVYLGAVESVREIEPEWSQWRYQRRSHTRAAEESRWIELSWSAPYVTSLVEGVHVEALTYPESKFRRSAEERLAERRTLRVHISQITRGRNGELLVTTQLLSELHATK